METTSKPRVLYFIVSYPTFSETYMHEEVRALRDQFDIQIITYKESRGPRRDPFPYRVIPYEDPCLVYGKIEQVDVDFERPVQREFIEQVSKVIEDFQPQILHGHYLGISLLLRHLGDRYELPFTIRTHSMDVLSEPDHKLDIMCEAANSRWCARVLSFPSNTPRLLEHGLGPEKLVDAWPVLNFQRFYKPEPRPLTHRVLCAGPAIPKKAHNDFIDLAAMMKDSDFSFDLYAMGPTLDEAKDHNAKAGDVVRIDYADPDDMPDVYPNYDWLVYPSDTEINKVGLPVVIAEAQASGLGVCWQELPGRREEQLEYMGGGGFLFRSIEEVPEILSRPYPEEMRRAGFEAAKRCDIERTKSLLSDVWTRSVASMA